MAEVKSSSQISIALVSIRRRGSEGAFDFPAIGLCLAEFFSVRGSSLDRGTRLSDDVLDPRRTDPEFGESFKASFHSWTLLTASLYSVDLVASTASDLLELTIHGCLRSFLADTRRFGSFWKHCIKKSSTTGDAPCGSGG